MKIYLIRLSLQPLGPHAQPRARNSPGVLASALIIAAFLWWPRFQLSAVFLAYNNRLSAVYQPLDRERPYYVLAVCQLYCRHISAVYPPYVSPNMPNEYNQHCSSNWVRSLFLNKQRVGSSPETEFNEISPGKSSVSTSHGYYLSLFNQQVVSPVQTTPH